MPTAAPVALGTLLIMFAAAVPQAHAQGAAPRNLQVLPPESSRAQVIARMRDITSGLGVRCSHCHVHQGPEADLSTYEFENDAKLTKRTAREMMRMVERLNRELPRVTIASNPEPMRIDCITCHRGLPRPMMLEDTLQAVVRNQGTDSLESVYRRLRDRYYGRFAFDFGERSLNVLAERLAPQQARVALELNAREFPESWNVAALLGRTYEAVGDTTHAIEQYEKALRLLPDHGPTRQRLERLRP